MRKVIVFLLRGYKYLFSPLLGTNCRFQPTCSEFAIQAVMELGVLKGGWLAICRIIRCRPGVESGYDPVPRNDANVDSTTNKFISASTNRCGCDGM